MNKAPLFTELSSVDSTNNYAMAMVHAGMARHGAAWFANEQTAGKGQRGKDWLGRPGENIAISIVLYPLQLGVSRQFSMSMATALACYEFFSRHAGLETSIKWPNDLYWRDRKTGGVLIENVLAGREWKCSVVGIGINVNQTEFHHTLKNPGSLKMVTGKHYDVIAMAKELHELVLHYTDRLSKPGTDELFKSYNSQLFRLNETVKLKKDNAVFETVVQGVTENGKLVTRDTIERTWDFGEVEWVL